MSVVEFAAKLRMAASALGCHSRKELCARFRAANPATQCDIDRLNKWVQGRSLPRAGAVYADLALVIGSRRSGVWIAGCTIAEFGAELAACTGAEGEMPPEPPHRHAPRASGLFGGMATLFGSFAAYSPAWSPHFRGQWVRGSLRLSAGRNGGVAATYTETLLGREVRLTTDAWIGGRSIHYVVRDPDGDMPLFVSAMIPGPPASVLCGVMSGNAFVAPEPLPSACRILFVRVADSPVLDAGNRYFTPQPGALAADLTALGLNLAEADRLDGFARDFLGTAPLQVTPPDQATLSALLDPAHLGAA